MNKQTNWIKMATNLHEMPQVQDIAERLSIQEFLVVGMLWRVWSWASSHSISGRYINTTEDRLDKMVNEPGFCAALRAVGWLTGEDHELTIHRIER